MNANVTTQMITYFPLRWLVSIYMLLVIFFIRSRFSEWNMDSTDFYDFLHP